MKFIEFNPKYDTLELIVVKGSKIKGSIVKDIKKAKKKYKKYKVLSVKNFEDTLTTSVIIANVD